MLSNQQQSLLSAKVQQDFSGIRILAAHRREERAYERFQKAADEYKFRTLDLVKVDAMFMPIIVMLVGLSTILTIYVGGLRVFSGDLQLGHIFQFVFYVNLLTWPFASVGWVTSLVQKAVCEPSAHQRLPGCRSRDRRTPPMHPRTSKAASRFKGVGLTYPRLGNPRPRRM